MFTLAVGMGLPRFEGCGGRRRAHRRGGCAGWCELVGTGPGAATVMAVLRRHALGAERAAHVLGPAPGGRISKVPLCESPRSLPAVVVTTSRLAVGLWYGPISSTRPVSLSWRARTGIGGPAISLNQSVPRNVPSDPTAAMRRNGVPVSDALR